jgi:histidinol dehydrogenase
LRTRYENIQVFRIKQKANSRKLVQRNVDPANEIRAIVEDVIDMYSDNGDSALFDYANKFDKVELTSFILTRTN